MSLPYPIIALAMTLLALVWMPSSLYAQTIVSPWNNDSPIPVRKAAIHAKDTAYQNGADIYFGRQGYKKFAFCLAMPGDAASLEPVPLTRKSIRAFRNSDVLTFVNSVVDCHEPDTLIFRQLDQNGIRNLLYYFEKKHGLRLGR